MALRWLDADQVADQVADQLLAAAPKSLLAILAELHPAIADVATSRVVCSQRFSSARAAVIQDQAAIRVHLRDAAHAVDRL